jgi:hypothetical protein
MLGSDNVVVRLLKIAIYLAVQNWILGCHGCFFRKQAVTTGYIGQDADGSEGDHVGRLVLLVRALLLHIVKLLSSHQAFGAEAQIHFPTDKQSNTPCMQQKASKSALWGGDISRLSQS